jgi:membrane protein required for beta-lactamase induction
MRPALDLPVDERAQTCVVDRAIDERRDQSRVRSSEDWLVVHMPSLSLRHAGAVIAALTDWDWYGEFSAFPSRRPFRFGDWRQS